MAGLIDQWLLTPQLFITIKKYPKWKEEKVKGNNSNVWYKND